MDHGMGVSRHWKDGQLRVIPANTINHEAPLQKLCGQCYRDPATRAPKSKPATRRETRLEMRVSGIEPLRMREIATTS
jgi:hypothetical protein